MWVLSTHSLLVYTDGHFRIVGWVREGYCINFGRICKLLIHYRMKHSLEQLRRLVLQAGVWKVWSKREAWEVGFVRFGGNVADSSNFEI